MKHRRTQHLPVVTLLRPKAVTCVDVDVTMYFKKRPTSPYPKNMDLKVEHEFLREKLKLKH